MTKKDLIREEIISTYSLLKNTDSKAIKLNAMNKLAALGLNESQITIIVKSIYTI